MIFQPLPLTTSGSRSPQLCQVFPNSQVLREKPTKKLQNFGTPPQHSDRHSWALFFCLFHHLKTKANTYLSSSSIFSHISEFLYFRVTMFHHLPPLSIVSFLFPRWHQQESVSNLIFEPHSWVAAWTFPSDSVSYYRQKTVPLIKPTNNDKMNITRLLMFVPSVLYFPPTFSPHPWCHQQEGVPNLIFEPRSWVDLLRFQTFQ